MAHPDRTDLAGEFLAVLPLDAEEHAVTVATQAGMVVLALLGPVSTISTTLSPREARDVALAVINASQHQGG